MLSEQTQSKTCLCERAPFCMPVRPEPHVRARHVRLGPAVRCHDSRVHHMTQTRVQRLPVVNGVELHILAKRDWGSLIFVPVWLIFWTFGELTAMKWVIHPGPSTPRAFISLWLVGWLLGEVLAIYSWLWAAFGKEIVTIKEGSLNVRRDVGEFAG